MTEISASGLQPSPEFVIELTRIGHRQTLLVVFKDEEAVSDFMRDILSNEVGMIALSLHSGRELVIDASSVWSTYRLSNSYLVHTDWVEIK